MSNVMSFTSRVNRRAERDRLQQQVRITLDTQDDETGDVTFSEGYTFTRPSEGRLFLMATAFGAAAKPENAASEVDATLRDMLLHDAPRQSEPKQRKGNGEYLALRARIDGDIDRRIELDDIMEILGQLVEHWSDGFPTQPSVDSSMEQQQTGGRSTGRVHSPESTRSNYPSDDFFPSSTPGSLGE